MLALHKLLPLIVSPLGLVVGLLILSVVLRRRAPTVLALGILLIGSLPLTGNRLWIALESDYPFRPIASVEKADAVVVLSGTVRSIKTSEGVVTQWGNADRFMAGIDLVKAGKAPLIIFTRGQQPWSNLPPEGEILAQRAISMGVRSDQILLTGIVTNTADEAEEVRALVEFAGMERLLLVTSAFHMPRAKKIFDRVGINSVPYPTDFKSSSGKLDWLAFIPSANGLNTTSKAVREFIGRLYYSIKYATENRVVTP